MVEVAVREDDPVDAALDFVQPRQGLAAVKFGVEAAVDDQPHAAEFGEHAVGADFAAGVEVGKSHQERSGGGVIAKAGIRTKTRRPSAVVPWKAPSAVSAVPVRW